MAINFPDSPVNGDTHVVGNVTYVYNNAKNKWVGAGQTPNDRLTEGSNSLEITAGNDLVWTGDAVGLKNSSPVMALDIGDGTQQNTLRVNSSTVSLVSLTSGNTLQSRIEFGDPDNDDTGYIYYDNSVDSMRFATNGSNERLRITSNGDLKHTGLRSGGGENKLAILVTPSHNTNEEDVIVYQVENESSFNQITFGGGTASYNAATKLSFKTASAVDTTGGTERFSIDSNGIVRSHSTGISGSSLTLDLGSGQLVAGFQAKEMSGAAQALSGYWFNHGGLNAGIASTRQVTNQWGTDLRFYTHPFTVSNQNFVYERFKIDPDGRIFIRDLLGNASSGSAVKYSNSDDELRYDTSSRLLKTNITECPYGIETVKKLKPSGYTPQEYDREGNINVTFM